MNGYVYEWCPTHPYALYGMVMQHRLVMEVQLGRFLERKERVHHHNHTRNDNQPENLVLFANQAAHMRAHHDGKGKSDPELVERVRQAAADQTTPSSALGISSGLLWTILHENGIEWHSRGQRGRVAGMTDKTVREALRGRTTIEAAAHLGVHVQTIYNRFDHLLTKRTKPGTLDPHMSEVLRLRRVERLSSAEIGAKFGVSDACVRKSIQRWSKQGAIPGVSDAREIPHSRAGPKRGYKRLGKAW